LTTHKVSALKMPASTIFNTALPKHSFCIGLVRLQRKSPQ